MSRRDWLVLLGVALLLLLLWWLLKRRQVTKTGGSITAWSDAPAGSSEIINASGTSTATGIVREKEVLI